MLQIRDAELHGEPYVKPYGVLNNILMEMKNSNRYWDKDELRERRDQLLTRLSSK